MASSLHKTPDTHAPAAKASKSSTENSAAKAQTSGKGKSMETEQIQAEKSGPTQNPVGQRAMDRNAAQQGSYPVNESGTGGGVGFEGRSGMNARGPVADETQPSFGGTYGQPEAGLGAAIQNLLDSVAKVQADIDVIKSGLNIAPANLTGPGVTGPAADQIKPQRIA